MSILPNRELADRIILWHTENGGFNARPAGHAVRMLREMVELCFAAGSTVPEVSQAVIAEIRKAREKGEVVGEANFERMDEEAADVAILFEVFKTYQGMDYRIHEAVEKKMAINEERLWEVDEDGVLWRPGRPDRKS